MLKIITSIFVSLIFFVLPSGTLAQAQNDFLQPESGVEIGNEFSEISDLVSHSLEKKKSGKQVYVLGGLLLLFQAILLFSMYGDKQPALSQLKQKNKMLSSKVNAILKGRPKGL